MSRWIKIAAAALLAVSAMGLASACGKHPDLEDISEGQSFEMGGLRYSVLFDRELNPAQTEDAGYVAGLPPPPRGQVYYGVFLIVKNESDEPVNLPMRADITMTDTNESVYTPVDNAGTDFAFPYGEPLAEDSEVPDPDSIAAAAPIQGSLFLFLIDEQSTADRPLELHIKNEDGEEATVALDV